MQRRQAWVVAKSQFCRRSFKFFRRPCPSANPILKNNSPAVKTKNRHSQSDTRYYLSIVFWSTFIKSYATPEISLMVLVNLSKLRPLVITHNK